MQAQLLWLNMLRLDLRRSIPHPITNQGAALHHQLDVRLPHHEVERIDPPLPEEETIIFRHPAPIVADVHLQQPEDTHHLLLQPADEAPLHPEDTLRPLPALMAEALLQTEDPAAQMPTSNGKGTLRPQRNVRWTLLLNSAVTQHEQKSTLMTNSTKCGMLLYAVAVHLQNSDPAALRSSTFLQIGNGRSEVKRKRVKEMDIKYHHGALI
jgi:hypothetical protein